MYGIFLLRPLEATVQFSINDMRAAYAAITDDNHAEIGTVAHDAKQMLPLYEGIGIIFSKNRHGQTFFQWRDDINITPFQHDRPVAQTPVTRDKAGEGNPHPAERARPVARLRHQFPDAAFDIFNTYFRIGCPHELFLGNDFTQQIRQQNDAGVGLHGYTGKTD